MHRNPVLHIVLLAIGVMLSPAPIGVELSDARRRVSWPSITLTTFCLLAPVAAGAVDSAPEMERLATYSAADRTEILAAGAKKEGTINFYTSIPVADINPVIEAFARKYGVRVSLWRSGSEEIVRRVVAEANAGRYEADIMDTNGPQMEAIYREQLLQRVNSPVFETLRPEALMPHRAWTTTRINVFAQAYNTSLLSKDQLPKDWPDLLDPKWKGKLGIEEGDLDWFSAVVKQVGSEEQGIELFRQIVRKNGISVRKGHTLVSNLVAAGEIPLALTTYHFEPENFKNSGAPIDWFSIGKLVVRPNGSGVTRRAPHPYAALLFYDFMLSDAQNLLADRSIEVTAKNAKSLIHGMPTQMIDSAEILDNFDRWSRVYNEVFIDQSR